MIVSFIISVLAVALTAWLLPGVGIDGFGWTVVTALVMGIINTIIKPVVSLFALPVNIITLGLFSIVINGLMVELCSWLVPAFHVDSFIWALAFSIVLAIVNWVLSLFFK